MTRRRWRPSPAARVVLYALAAAWGAAVLASPAGLRLLVDVAAAALVIAVLGASYLSWRERLDGVVVGSDPPLSEATHLDGRRRWARLGHPSRGDVVRRIRKPPPARRRAGRASVVVALSESDGRRVPPGPPRVLP